MKQIELLAPAKDLECGIAAIDCGADAVYIGAAQFGARETAGNALEDITKLVDYAHKYWARIYATVNTILRDDEIPQAERLISQLYDAGVDAIIIQDTGLLECELPPIPLIASTQMHNNTPEKVAFLERVGIQRAILARELDIDQIKAVRKATNIELEVFIHGALCVCYSGQCYLSYALGGRSGNRGACAQPCRKSYSLVDSQGKTLINNKHLLSLKDLNLSERLRELIEAGVCSFKIEGRLKDKAYVSNVVSFYRQKLDEILPELGMKKASSGASRIDFTPDVTKTFNRGYCTYFLHGKGDKIGSPHTPKMVGETIGKVVSVGKKGFTLDKGTLRSGDGICFLDRGGNLRGTVINQVQGNMVIPDKTSWIEQGTTIYRNHDHEFLTRLDKARMERQISVNLALNETSDGLSIAAIDEDGNKTEFAMPCEKALADKPEQALENIRKQLMKSGGTDYQCADVRIELEQTYFLPISTLNSLRRGVLEELSAVREKNRPVRAGGAVINEAPYPEKELSFTGNVLNRLAAQFYRRHGVTSIGRAAEFGMDLTGQRVMITRYCLKHQLGICPRDGKPKQLAEPLFLVDSEGHRLELRFNCAKCQMEIHLAGK